MKNFAKPTTSQPEQLVNKVYLLQKCRYGKFVEHVSSTWPQDYFQLGKKFKLSILKKTYTSVFGQGVRSVTKQFLQSIEDCVIELGGLAKIRKMHFPIKDEYSALAYFNNL